MLDVRDDLLEQVGDVVVVELVDDLAAVALAGDEPEVAQQPQLVRDRRALHADRLRELVDRRRARRAGGRGSAAGSGADSAWMLSAAARANAASARSERRRGGPPWAMRRHDS